MGISIVATILLVICDGGTLLVAACELPSPANEVSLTVSNESCSAATITLGNRAATVEVPPGSSFDTWAMRRDPGETLTCTLRVAVAVDGRELIRSECSPGELLATPVIEVRNDHAAFWSGGNRK
jgi:hypothetical protein